MKAEIEVLFGNNGAPSDQAEQEIRKLLRDNFQNLQHLEYEILKRLNPVRELLMKRDDMERTIQQYHSILSPLRRMSPEILGEIFRQCLPTHRNPIISPTECPLLLTHVCGFWRAAAMSQPRLWERIYITFDDMFVDPRQSMRSRAPKVLTRRLNIIKEWISRSGTRPLSISVCFSTERPMNTSRNIRDPDHRIVLEFFQFLAQLSPRIKDMELRMPLSAYRILESMINAPEMTELTSLRAELPLKGEYGHLDPLVLLKAPNLKKISLSADVDQLLDIRRPSHISVWRRMTDLSFHVPLSPTQLIFLLGHAPNLVHFKVEITMSPHSVSEPDVSSLVISLPFLRTFSIIDELGPDRLNLGLYNRINAPGLTWLEFTGRLNPGHWQGDYLDFSVASFLQRLPSLKKLTIDPDVLDWKEFRRICIAVPSITHLFLGYEARSAYGSPMRYPLMNDSWQREAEEDTICVFTLDELIVPDNESNVESDSSGPLLPNLISFDFTSDVSSLKDEDIITFATSRMKPPPPPPFSVNGSGPRIAQLKHLGVIFYRRKGLDIAEQIREYAEREGTDMIDLFLDYPEASAFGVMPFAPEYGLRDFDGSSWHNRDAEGFTDNF